MGHCIKQIIDKLCKIYKINLKGTVNYKLPNCTKLNDIILDVSGYGYYSSPNPQKLLQVPINQKYLTILLKT